MPELFHRKLERSAIGFVIAIIAAASVGGIVEIAPLFTIDETVEQAPDMRLVHAAGACRAQHLRPRGLLRLPQPDDPDAARRGRALRPLLAGRGVAVRPPDAVGLEADRTGPRPRRRQIFRLLACRAPDQSAGRRSGVEHARLPLAGPHHAEDGRPAAASGGAARARRALHRRDGGERGTRRLRPGDARTRTSRPASPSATARKPR